MQYDNKYVMKIAILVETKYLTRYPWPIIIIYDQGSEFIDCGFKNLLFRRNMGLKSIQYHQELQIPMQYWKESARYYGTYFGHTTYNKLM